MPPLNMRLMIPGSVSAKAIIIIRIQDEENDKRKRMDFIMD